jgi:hypothetical protein
MLCQFIFKNFKSYKDETILDLQAISKYGFESSLLKNDSDNKSFLPVSVIYGPNAGEKSNVFCFFIQLYTLALLIPRIFPTPRPLTPE